jgi:hypothetical protein
MFDDKEMDKGLAKKVFVSRPTVIDAVFESAYTRFERYIKRLGFVPCRLGAENYTLDAPLVGMIDLVRHCKGAVILGYPQYEFDAFIIKGGTREQYVSMRIPTPWNHIEATLAFQQHIPVLIVAQQGVVGGVFDQGVTGQYVIVTDLGQTDWHTQREFHGVFNEWKERLK